MMLLHLRLAFYYIVYFGLCAAPRSFHVQLWTFISPLLLSSFPAFTLIRAFVSALPDLMLDRCHVFPSAASLAHTLIVLSYNS